MIVWRKPRKNVDSKKKTVLKKETVSKETKNPDVIEKDNIATPKPKPQLKPKAKQPRSTKGNRRKK